MTIRKCKRCFREYNADIPVDPIRDHLYPHILDGASWIPVCNGIVANQHICSSCKRVLIQRQIRRAKQGRVGFH